MKNILFLFCFAMLAFRPAPEAGGGKLTLRFEGVEVAGGTVRLALYSKKGEFMSEERAILYNFKLDGEGALVGTLENLPTGSHAFAVFLDENNNKMLDKNLFGVPTEPYGFSKTPPSKWRLPTWEEVKFEVGQSDQALVVNLKRWALL